MIFIYAYRYGIVGGVSTQCTLRQAAFEEDNIECHIYFSQDNGLGDIVGDRKNIHFGSRKEFGKLIRKINPKAVIVIDSPELISHARGGWLNRTPVYLDVHTTTRRGLLYLNDLSPRQIAGVMTPTAYSSGLVRERNPALTPQIIPNIIDHHQFNPATTLTSANPDVREFVWVGKLDHHKNWRLALLYTRLLRDVLGPVRMTLVGGYTASDEQAQALFDLADQLDIMGSFQWIDRISNDSLAGIYQACALSGGAMLVTSRDESFGMAAAEALLCGCPLLTNDLPVFREVFPESPMIHRVDIWDPEAVAAAAGRLRDPVSPRDISDMRDYLTTHYGPEAFVSKFLQVIGA